MLRELMKAFFLIFAAEMGDKTQIIAMTFATQYKVKDVILGITWGVFLNHGIAIVLGRFISKIVPMNYIQIVAGIMFVVFGIMALKSDEEENIESNKAFSPIMTVGLAFFIGELGDKTQLTAMTLSSEGLYPFFILIGTTLGMIATSSVGIFIGAKLGNKIPETIIKIVSSFVFVLFGTLKLYNTVPENYLTTLNIIIYLAVVGFIEFILISRIHKLKKIQGDKSPLKEVAYNLYEQTRYLKLTLDSICLGEDKCKSCYGPTCLIGYTKYIIDEARKNNNYFLKDEVDIFKLIRKNYDRRLIVQALSIIISDYIKYGWEADSNFVINKVKSSFELILFGKKIKSNNYKEYIKEIKKSNIILGTNLERRINHLV